MEPFIQALIVAFREGLEAFIVVLLLLKFLDSSHNKHLKKNVWYGVSAGVVVSVIFGVLLFSLSTYLGGADAIGKLWESIASFIVVVLITTFIVWMIKHGDKIDHHITSKAMLNLSAKGIFLLSFFMLIREGVELAFFSFAGKYTLLPIGLGIIASLALVVLIYYSIVKVNLKTIFTVTLVFLIFQAGFLAGYSVHEGISASKDLGIIEEDNLILVKAFDLRDTALSHEDGIIGVPLSIVFGWYAKPEIIQFILQYGYVLALFTYWKRQKRA